MSELRRESMDDFENFIRHSDFGKILELAGTLKDQKRQLVTVALGQQQGPRGTSAPSLSLRARKKKKSGLNESQAGPQYLAQDGSAFGNVQEERPRSRRGDKEHPNSFDCAAELLRATLIPPAKEGSDPMTDVMGRGECLVTDSLIDETIKSLADELKLCLDLKKQLRGMSRQGIRSYETSSTEDQGMGANQVNWMGGDAKMEGGGGNGGEEFDEKAIANKFSKWQTDILTNWMIEHREHPFPTHSDYHELARATNLTDTQVVNWTTNVRKRNLKATVEREKKPHHFLDYLFLATDREQKMRVEHPEMDEFFDNAATNSFGGYEGNRFAPREETLQQTRGLQNKFAGHNLNNAPAPFQPPPYGYAPSHPNHRMEFKNDQQPDIHHRQAVAPPKAPRNTGQIFRRGKRLNDLKQKGYSSKKAELPYDQFAVAQHDAQLKQARERERMVLQEYDPHGIIDTPPGSFDENEGRLYMDDIDEDMFNEHGRTTGVMPTGMSDNEERRQAKAVSFESMSMADVPFDENAEDYLMRLIHG